jgi:D-aminopeptidase
MDLPNSLLSPLFEAAIEATEESIYNSLLLAENTTGVDNMTVQALQVDDVLGIVQGGFRSDFT